MPRGHDVHVREGVQRCGCGRGASYLKQAFYCLSRWANQRVGLLGCLRLSWLEQVRRLRCLLSASLGPVFFIPSSLSPLLSLSLSPSPFLTHHSPPSFLSYTLWSVSVGYLWNLILCLQDKASLWSD